MEGRILGPGSIFRPPTLIMNSSRMVRVLIILQQQIITSMFMRIMRRLCSLCTESLCDDVPYVLNCYDTSATRLSYTATKKIFAYKYALKYCIEWIFTKNPFKLSLIYWLFGCNLEGFFSIERLTVWDPRAAYTYDFNFKVLKLWVFSSNNSG